MLGGRRQRSPACDQTKGVGCGLADLAAIPSLLPCFPPLQVLLSGLPYCCPSRQPRSAGNQAGQAGGAASCRSPWRQVHHDGEGAGLPFYRRHGHRLHPSSEGAAQVHLQASERLSCWAGRARRPYRCGRPVHWRSMVQMPCSAPDCRRNARQTWWARKTTWSCRQERSRGCFSTLLALLAVLRCHRRCGAAGRGTSGEGCGQLLSAGPEARSSG